jgi:hypothetical protein
MKNLKTKSSNKFKQKEKIEIDLSKKIKDFVISLGHDASDINVEIKKASKILAKKLSKKLNTFKDNVADKFKAKEVKKTTKKEVAKAEKKAEKVVKKVAKKIDKVSVQNKDKVAPIVKKATSVAKLNTLKVEVKPTKKTIAKPKVTSTPTKAVVKPKVSPAKTPVVKTTKPKVIRAKAPIAKSVAQKTTTNRVVKPKVNQTTSSAPSAAKKTTDSKAKTPVKATPASDKTQD